MSLVTNQGGEWNKTRPDEFSARSLCRHTHETLEAWPPTAVGDVYYSARCLEPPSRLP